MEIPKGVKYKSAFKLGYDFAFDDDGKYEYGVAGHIYDLKAVPRNIKDKDAWIDDWQWGCAIGCECN